MSTEEMTVWSETASMRDFYVDHSQVRFLEILSHHNLMSPHALRQLNG